MKKKNVYGKWALVLLPVLAALYFLYPTYEARELDAERSALLGDSAKLEQWDDVHGKDFDRARAKRLKLGLDLRGGMYVTLEVDLVRMIEEAADPVSVDQEFVDILNQTRAETKNTDLDVVDVFVKKMAAKGKSLLQYFSAANNADISEASVRDQLEKDAKGALEQAYQVISQRINQYGVSEAAIQKVGARRLIVELPDVKDEREVRQLLEQAARLEFKRVVVSRDVLAAIQNVDKIIKGDAAIAALVPADTAATVSQADSTKADSTKTDSTAAAASDTTDPYAGLSPEEASRRMRADHPFSSMILMSGAGLQNLITVSQLRDISAIDPGVKFQLLVTKRELPKIMAILDRPEVRLSFPAEFILAIGVKEYPAGDGSNNGFYDMVAVARETDLTGDVIENAYQDFDPSNGKPSVSMSMDADGAERWYQITKAAVGKQIAILLDGRVYSAPVVQNPIPGGNSMINGMGSVEEATILAVVLKAGALKAPVKIIEERIIGPSLGEDSIRRGLVSTAISFAFIIVFMLAYYAMGGAVANVALLMNVLLVVASLASFGFTLTLPGIAGIILSVAMAVDANILVFERIREELAIGKSMRVAVDLGFSKAMSAILDSNITHVLSAGVLLALGTGPIKGFALTLIVGVFVTLFTAVLVSRAIFEIMIAYGATSINFGQKKTATA